jgi:hypothetical protein
MPVLASMNSALRRCIRFPGSDKAIPASGIDPAPHRLGGVGRVVLKQMLARGASR